MKSFEQRHELLVFFNIQANKRFIILLHTYMFFSQLKNKIIHRVFGWNRRQ